MNLQRANDRNETHNGRMRRSTYSSVLIAMKDAMCSETTKEKMQPADNQNKTKEETGMRMDRLIGLCAGIVLLFAGLALRLFWLQSQPAAATRDGMALIRQSVNQRRTDVVLDEGRGRITDRHGRPLAGIGTRALLIQPADDVQEEEVERAARMLGEPPSRLRYILDESPGPALWVPDGEREPAALDGKRASMIAASGLDWLRVVPYRRRYDDPPRAAHVVGFVLRRDRIGAAGLERTFEPFLRSRGARRLSFYRTATGSPLEGLDVRLAEEGNGFYPLTLVTTIDGALQRRAEHVLRETGIDDGAVIVLDVASGDLLAMASAPGFDPDDVNPEDGRWRNRGLVAEAPGSVFKTVIAAAALDAGVTRPGETFRCGGKHELGRVRCHRPGGHGILTLEEAFAQSCNTVFAELALRLGAPRLERAAARYGIGRPAGWRTARLDTPIVSLRDFAQMDGEETGRLFDPRDPVEDPAVVARAGIGQQSVRLTPLKVAQWTAAVAAGGGGLPAPRAVSQIRFKNGRVMVDFPKQTVPGTGFSGYSARWLKRAMALAATNGTAAGLSDVPGGAAGKTGTAETGRDGRVHQWFTGYYPRHNPRYAVTIIARHRPANSRHLATEAAGRLLRSLAGKEWKEGERTWYDVSNVTNGGVKR